MTINEYQQEALRTQNVSLSYNDQLMNGVAGLNGEAGEAIDIVKKHLYQGHKLDPEHLAKELGDVAWYMAVTAAIIGYDLEDIMMINVRKLRKRYPDGFDTDKSVNRKGGGIDYGK